jgi:hypothetical protein
MSVLKKGVRFVSQDTNLPMLDEEVPFIITSLTPTGLRRAAIVGFACMQARGYSINQALEILGDKPKEKK